MKLLLEEAQYVCNISPSNEVNAPDMADTVGSSSGASSFKHRYICSHSAPSHLTQTHPFFCFSHVSYMNIKKPHYISLVLTQIQANIKEREVLSTHYIFLPSHTVITAFSL